MIAEKEFTAASLWSRVRAATGKDQCTWEELLDSLEALGISEGQLDGAVELILHAEEYGEARVVIHDEELNCRDIHLTTEFKFD